MVGRPRSCKAMRVSVMRVALDDSSGTFLPAEFIAHCDGACSRVLSAAPVTRGLMAFSGDAEPLPLRTLAIAVVYPAVERWCMSIYDVDVTPGAPIDPNNVLLHHVQILATGLDPEVLASSPRMGQHPTLASLASTEDSCHGCSHPLTRIPARCCAVAPRSRRGRTC